MSVQKKVAVTFYYLLDGIKTVTHAIPTHLASTYIKLPTSEQEVQASAANFFKHFGFSVVRCSGWYIYSDIKTE